MITLARHIGLVSHLPTRQAVMALPAGLTMAEVHAAAKAAGEEVPRAIRLSVDYALLRG